MKPVNILIISITILSFWSCNSEQQYEQQKKIEQITITTVEELPISNPIITSGRLSSKTEVKLSFKTGGIIENIYVKEGQLVKQVDILA